MERCPVPPADSDEVYVVSRGWHVEIGLPADEISGPLAFYRRLFPTARSFMFSYGKRTFFTAPTDDIGEYFLGPIPGPAAIQVIGLSVLPADAYTPGETTVLSLPRNGAAALSNFVWNDIVKDGDGKPKFISTGALSGIRFYAAESQYNLFHTCNTWAVDALAAAGLPVSSDNVIFSGQVVARAEAVRECQAAGR